MIAPECGAGRRHPGAEAVPVLPETLLRCHRELIRREGLAYQRRPPRRRSQPDLELHDLILRLAREISRLGLAPHQTI